MRIRPRPGRPRGARARRGIYILPSLLTVGNIFAGYWSILAATRGEFAQAALLLLVAAVLDNLDGRVARMTGTTTEFGVHFDSMADVLSFGIAPAFLVYQWGMQDLGRVGAAAPFLFVVCGAMRLARFNVQIVPDKRYFVGLPIPAGALVVAALVFYAPQRVTDFGFAVVVLLLVLTLSGLMCSRLRYHSFKTIDASGRQSFLIVALLAVILAAVAIDPQVALLVLSLLYMLSGLLPRWPQRSARREKIPVASAGKVDAAGPAGRI